MIDEYSDADAPAVDDGVGLPQHDLIAEQSVLGGMLLSVRAVDDVIDALQPADFYQPKHELIARAIGTVHGRGEPVDPITVSEELRRTEKLSRAGGAAYLHELTSIVPTAANAGFYAATVRELAGKRRMVAAGIRIQGMGNASEGVVDDLVERARVELDKVTSGRRRGLKPMGASFDQLFTELDSEPEFLPSPWEALNKIIGGFARGNLYIIAARPGGGKSVALLQAAATLAHKGLVAFSSLEMTELELQKRLLAQFGDVHMTSLRNHTLSSEEWERLAKARVAVQEAPIYVDENSGAAMADIRAHARAVGRKGHLAGVAIDYLQLIKGDGRDRREVVDALSRQAKQLAKDLRVPVIAAAQLKRAGSRKGLPTMDDLRESGGLEQDADVVLLLDRDRERRPDEVAVVVAKNRHGDVGRFTLRWQAQFARLRDRAWSPTALFEGEG